VSEQRPARSDPASVVEVVVSVIFNCLPASASVHFASFWKSDLAELFPRIEEQAPYDHDRDHDVNQPSGPDLGHRSAEPDSTTARDRPTHRLWFANKAGDQLLQLQRNWFAGNWRRTTQQSQDDDWPVRRESFVGWLRRLDAHLAEAGDERLDLRQYEVTYVSHIHAGKAWKHHGEFDKVFRSAGLDTLPPYLRRESVRLDQEFLILGRDGPPEGRLRVKARPVYAASSRAPVYVLELAVRGTPPRLRMDRIGESLDLGRTAILDAMAALTVDAAAGRTNGTPLESATRPTDHIVRPPRDPGTRT
jgi:hypothetical protein